VFSEKAGFDRKAKATNSVSRPEADTQLFAQKICKNG
jgi:hypothetical protein